MDEQIEEEISKDDNTPSVLDQAHAQGWKAQYYHFGKAEGGRDWFNPSIVERDDAIWMLVRGSEPHPQGFRFGQNSIWAFEMDEEGKTPKRGIRLKWTASELNQHFEDPRGFFHEGIYQTIVGACTFTWNNDGTWTGAHQCIGSFDDKWECSKMDYPRIGGSPGRLEMITDKKRYEKNWLPFLHDSKLHILYKANPWLIFGFGQTWSEVQKYEGPGVNWAHGDVRGGTSPVKVGDYYFTFPHSSLMWRGRYRRYYAGAMAFDAKPPFTPRMITPEPLLRGSQNDPWAQRKPLVIFPCGALHRKGTWLITAGVNDMKAAWIEIPHEDILARMVPIGKTSETVFPTHGLSDTEVRKEKLRANLVKARAVRAAKLALTSLDPETLAMRAEAGRQESEEEQKDITEMAKLAVTQMREERLTKLRANLVKARAARAAKRMAKVEEFHLPEDTQKMIDKHGTSGEIANGGGTWTVKTIKRRKRRKRRTKAQMAEARLVALKEFEEKKSVA